MKKIILSIVSVLLLTSCAQSQWFNSIKGNGNVINKTRKVGNYDEIAVSGAFDITLVSGKEGKLSIKIEDNLLEHLITEVSNGKLRIKWKKGVNIRTKKGVFITIPFKDIEAVTLSGSSDIVSEDTINANEFYTAISGSGDITLPINAKAITAKITGSGDITLFGKTNHLKTTVTGSGDFHGFKLQAKNTIASVTGSGDIAINVSEELKARVTGSGDIDYMGNPEVQDTKVTGSGDITQK